MAPCGHSRDGDAFPIEFALATRQGRRCGAAIFIITSFAGIARTDASHIAVSGPRAGAGFAGAASAAAIVLLVLFVVIRRRGPESFGPGVKREPAARCKRLRTVF